MIKLSSKILRIAEVASTDKLRPALTGVLFEEKEDGTFEATATDGRLLINVNGDSQDKEEINAKRKPFKAILPRNLFRYFKFGRKSLGISEDSGRVFFETVNEIDKKGRPESNFTEIAIKEKPIDENFPDCESLIPKEEPFFSIAVNPRLLRRIADVIDSLRNDPYNPVRLNFYGATKRIIIENTDLDGFKIKAMITPMRDERTLDMASKNVALRAYEQTIKLKNIIQ